VSSIMIWRQRYVPRWRYRRVLVDAVQNNSAGNMPLAITWQRSRQLSELLRRSVAEHLPAADTTARASEAIA
jgi:hypothetical protein